MKRMFNVVIILLLIYIAIQIIFGILIKRHTITYSLSANGDIYNIKEVFNSKHQTKYHQDKDFSSYYYEISDEKNNFLVSLKIIGDYNGKEQFLEDIRVYNDGNIFCAYPIFQDKEQTLDLICSKNKQQMLYSNLKGSDANLDAFVSNLIKAGYYHYGWSTTNVKTKELNNIEIYEGNIPDKEYIALWNYKGLYNITSEETTKLSLLLNDQYDNNLSFMYGKYYIIPNYNKKNNFSGLIKVDLETSKVKNISLEASISYNSFIQGIIKNDVYIVDKNNNLQYKIDLNNGELSIVGDKDSASLYYNNEWQTKTIYDIVDNDLKFGYDINIPSALSKYKDSEIDSVLGDTDGYYYLYISNSNNINVYSIDKQNIEKKTLLFQVPNISNIKYAKDNLYFISNDILYIYSNKLGLRPLVKYSELLFNKSDMYKIYIKD